MDDGSTQKVDRDERKMRLGQSVQNEVLKGGTVESRDDFQAVIRFGKPVNHILHLVLTLVTCGFWSLVWLIVWIMSTQSQKTVTLTADEYGQILRQEV